MKSVFLKSIALALTVTLTSGFAMAQQQTVSKASPQMEAVKVATKQMIDQGFGAKFDGSTDPFHLRQIIEMAQEYLAIEPNVEITPVVMGGIEGELQTPQGARDDAILIYIHGGGMICGNAKASRGYASALAGESKFPVYTLTYRLAPEHKFPAGLDDCFAFYKAVISKHPGKPVFLLGESAGAYYTLVTAMKARDNGVKMPAAIFPYSPLIDLSGALNRRRAATHDFTITEEGMKWMGDLYCQPEDQKNPYASPYYDDLHGMPPTFLAWDQSETLAADSEEVVKKLLEQGTECYFKAYPDCFHAFALTGRGTPESYEVMRNTINFIEAHINK